MFFGPKITTVFASRWKALGWSAGVLMTAYCTIPSADEDGAGSAAGDPAVAMVSGLTEAGAASPDSRQSPWAIHSPAPAK